MKAALDPRVRALCRPLLFGDPTAVARHAKVCGIDAEIRVVNLIGDTRMSYATVALSSCPSSEATDIGFGGTSAAGGRASLAAASAAIQSAIAGAVDAVVAAPQNQTSIALAGIEFDGYPSFVAREADLDPCDVYLMLCFGDVKIVHCTLHVSVKEAI